MIETVQKTERKRRLSQHFSFSNANSDSRLRRYGYFITRNIHTREYFTQIRIFYTDNTYIYLTSYISSLKYRHLQEFMTRNSIRQKKPEIQKGKGLLYEKIIFFHSTLQQKYPLAAAALSPAFHTVLDTRSLCSCRDDRSSFRAAAHSRSLLFPDRRRFWRYIHWFLWWICFPVSGKRPLRKWSGRMETRNGRCSCAKGYGAATDIAAHSVRL